MTLEEMVEAYKNDVRTLTERGKAVREKALWEACMREGAHRSGERKHMRREWLRDVVGVPIKESERRQSLLSVGSAAEPIWEEIEHRNLHPQSASVMLTIAKVFAHDENIPMREAVPRAVASYNARPITIMVDGMVVKKRELSPRGSPRPRAAGIRSKRKQEKPATEEAPFLNQVRKQLLEHVESQLKHSPPFVADLLTRNFRVGLSVLFDDLRRGLKKAIEQDASYVNTASAERKRVVAACHTLNVPVPRVGKPVDLKAALLNRRRLAFEYHVDRHGGDTSTAHLYIEVNNAYDTLEKYNEQFDKKEIPNGDPGAGGGSDVEAPQQEER